MEQSEQQRVYQWAVLVVSAARGEVDPFDLPPGLTARQAALDFAAEMNRLDTYQDDQLRIAWQHHPRPPYPLTVHTKTQEGLGWQLVFSGAGGGEHGQPAGDGPGGLPYAVGICEPGPWLEHLETLARRAHTILRERREASRRAAHAEAQAAATRPPRPTREEREAAEAEARSQVQARYRAKLTSIMQVSGQPFTFEEALGNAVSHAIRLELDDAGLDLGAADENAILHLVAATVAAACEDYLPGFDSTRFLDFCF